VEIPKRAEMVGKEGPPGRFQDQSTITAAGILQRTTRPPIIRWANGISKRAGTLVWGGRGGEKGKSKAIGKEAPDRPRSAWGGGKLSSPWYSD